MSDASPMRPWTAPGALAVLLLAAAVLAWNLGGYDLWAPDEPYFGEGARETPPRAGRK